MTATSPVLDLPSSAAGLRVLDVASIREDFPILRREVHGKRLVYLDNAATSQKPRAVIEALIRFYQEDCANIHRGVHLLSERATEAFEAGRVKAQRFINARDAREIVFVRGTTEGVNLVAHSYGRQHVREGDEIVVTTMEHHSNIVPWQMLCEEKGATLRVAPINDSGELILGDLERLLNSRTRLVAVAHVSNALGTINPIRDIVDMAHRRGVPVLVDGAQGVPHLRVDVQEMGCDFYTFSGHKMFGPTGIGVLYGRLDMLERMPPYEGGGSMISSVTFDKTLYAPPPYRFEAGTPDIAGPIGLGAAIDYLGKIGIDRIAEYEHELVRYGTEALSAVPGLRLIGTAREKAAVLSFVMDDAHPHDIGTILDREGIAIRTGHHCAQPLMHRFGVPATARASLAFYNTTDEIDALVDGLRRVREVLA
jgi:cysteine desulfurase/selenocysteine lyase